MYTLNTTEQFEQAGEWTQLKKQEFQKRIISQYCQCWKPKMFFINHSAHVYAYYNVLNK